MAKRPLLRLAALLLFVVLAGLACGDSSGACEKNFGGVQGKSCTESTAGECDSIGGDFTDGKTCRDLGYPN